MTQIDPQILIQMQQATARLTAALQQVTGPVTTATGTVVKGSSKTNRYINKQQVRRLIEQKFNKKYPQQ